MGWLAKLFGRDDTAVVTADGVTTAILKNPATGATQLHVSAGGDDFEKLSRAILGAVMTGYNKHRDRRDFEGEVKITILRDTPPAVVAQLPSLKEKLRGMSLASIVQGPKPLRFEVQEEGGSIEIVDGTQLLGGKDKS